MVNFHVFSDNPKTVQHLKYIILNLHTLSPIFKEYFLINSILFI